MLFIFYADDIQVYISFEREHSSPLEVLLLCLEEVRAWMASNFLHFSDSKTELMVFSPSAAARLCPPDLGPLVRYLQSTVTNLGVKMDSDSIFDRQIGAVVNF